MDGAPWTQDYVEQWPFGFGLEFFWALKFGDRASHGSGASKVDLMPLVADLSEHAMILPRGSNVVPFWLRHLFSLGVIIYYPKRNYIRASGYL